MFCTIMSTLMSASASGSEQCRRDAGPVGHADTVTLASDMSVHDAGDDRIFHVGLLLGDPRAGLPGERGPDVERDVVVAGELDRAHGGPWTAGAGHLEHLVEGDAVASLRACGTIRGSVVNTPVTSV